MGIRFYCPNGHKLNVKSYLAGKRGICPHCSAKLLIPDLTTNRDEDGPAVPRMGAPAATNSAYSAEPHTASIVPAGALPLASTGEVPNFGPEIAITTDAASETPYVDPIDENPAAVWYVRLASGNQYGPAAGEVFRTWLAEGRITPDSLVWREGWPEWQTASAVFPQLIR